MKKIYIKVRFYIENMFNKYILTKNKVEYKALPIINGKLFLRNNGGFIIDGKLKINSRASANPIGGDTRTVIMVQKKAKLYIGNNVGISNSAIICNDKITIQDNVLIGGSCKIWDSNFHPLNYEDRINNNNQYTRTKPILIKEGAFIGGNSIILKGVTIGRRSIIGAGSVVSSDIPDNEIWGGNPARFIRKID